MRSTVRKPVPTWRTVSKSEEETVALGKRFGSHLAAGDVVALVGELGAGKTRFVRGLADGMGIRDNRVSSPTFTIRHDHPGNPPLLHLDFYRLSDPAEVDWLGMFESVDSTDAPVVVIEWADRLHDTLPDDRVDITMTIGPGVEERTMTWEAHGIRGTRALAAMREGCAT